MGKKSREKVLGENYKENRQFKAIWDKYLQFEYIETARYHFNRMVRVG